MPPPPVYSPAESAELFELAEPGYRIELVASEPMVQDPVAIRFDGQGRLWVVEMRSYMQDIDGGGAHDPIGRVSVLEDLDGDGLMDKSTVFLDNLVLPRAIALLPDGVLIAENKPLYFYPDLNQDLVPDSRQLVDKNYARDSIEHSANGLYRALDNWYYNAKEGHRLRRQNGVWVREETEERGQWGICQDDWGRLFYNYNHSQLHGDVVPPNTLTRNPHHSPTTGLSVGVVASNVVHPVRETYATNRGYIPGALDERGRIQQFTSACAPFIYREALFPEFAGNAFVCETAGNLVKRNVLNNHGFHPSGAPAYPDRDFLASKDERFRPCWIEAGPDGALYIVDMYRGIVQDAPHMSPYLREHSLKREMVNPIHLGRIWRIVPDDFPQPSAPNFAAKTAQELVALLEHPGGWWRDQAQMNLVEQRLQNAIPTLQQMAIESESERARLHALWTLQGLDSTDYKPLLPTLKDPSWAVQTAAIRTLPQLGMPDQELAEYLAALASPPEPVVLQAILTLGDLDIPDDHRFALLADLILPRAGDPLMRDAVLSSLSAKEAAFTQALWPRLPKDPSEHGGERFLLESLTQACLKSRDSTDIHSLLTMLQSTGSDWRAEALLKGIHIQRATLVQAPVTLSSKPDAHPIYPELAKYFAWPGHQPPPPLKTTGRPLTKSEQELYTTGRQIFLTSCAACHREDGLGTKLLAPPLAGSDWVTGSDRRLIRVLLHGLSGPIHVSGKHYTVPEIQPVMPPLAHLGNKEIAAVLTYIRREWGNDADPISANRVSKIRIASQGRTVPWTASELTPYIATDSDPLSASDSR